MIKTTLLFEMPYLLGTLVTDMLREHKRLAIEPSADLVEIFDQQRIDVSGSAGYRQFVMLIHRRQLPVFTLFLSDVNDFLVNGVDLNRETLQTPEGLKLVQRLLDLQELRNKVDFARDFPDSEVYYFA